MAREGYCFGGQRMTRDRSTSGWNKRLAGPGISIATLLLFTLAVIGPSISARQSPEKADVHDPDTRNPATSEWPLVGGDLGGRHYSALKQVNLQNVKNLGGAWYPTPLMMGLHQGPRRS